MSDTAITVAVTGLVTLIAAFGGQWLAGSSARKLAEAARRHERRSAVRDALIEYVDASRSISSTVGQMLFAMAIGLDAAQERLRDGSEGDLKPLDQRHSRAVGILRLTTNEPSLMAAVDPAEAMHEALLPNTFEPATTELMQHGRASRATVDRGLAYLRDYDAAITRVHAAAAPLLVESLTDQPRWRARRKR